MARSLALAAIASVSSVIYVDWIQLAWPASLASASSFFSASSRNFLASWMVGGAAKRAAAKRARAADRRSVLIDAILHGGSGPGSDRRRACPTYFLRSLNAWVRVLVRMA